ncbi:hypothetical protein CC86DRAFT_47200 [Ophiobolus disseminans]|uniref:Uncharacterized protein n=1 Tax=Ophiobolus disseminans TaxID=1469910 RepID=A0A6A6ZVF3_9PLEO|nr:hypothetical protein CC86DRAFT_47200 [Ophiobolus disseminans]
MFVDTTTNFLHHSTSCASFIPQSHKHHRTFQASHVLGIRASLWRHLDLGTIEAHALPQASGSYKLSPHPWLLPWCTANTTADTPRPLQRSLCWFHSFLLSFAVHTFTATHFNRILTAVLLDSRLLLEAQATAHSAQLPGCPTRHPSSCVSFA